MPVGKSANIRRCGIAHHARCLDRDNLGQFRLSLRRYEIFDAGNQLPRRRIEAIAAEQRDAAIAGHQIELRLALSVGQIETGFFTHLALHIGDVVHAPVHNVVIVD